MKATHKAIPAALAFEASEAEPALRQRVPAGALSHMRALKDSSMGGAHA